MNTMLLFCLPHAGGSALFYSPLEEYLPPWIELCPLELPGRSTRATEPLLTDFEALVHDVIRQIREKLGKTPAPYALFGHSIGALLAYRATQLLTETPPLRLFLSSPPLFFNRETQKNDAQPRRSTYQQEDFLAQIQKLGGLSPEVLASSEFIAYIEPILRADFCALETWTPPLTPPLSLPLTFFVGEKEQEETDSRRVGYWAAKTTGTFNWAMFPGGHFYMTEHWKEVADRLAQDCERSDAEA